MSAESAPQLNIPPSSVERNRKIKEIRTQIFLGSLSMQDKMRAMDEISFFAKRLKTKYPNSIDYRVYHTLVSSTVNNSHVGIIEDDFPGEDSVEKFFDGLEKKYLQNK